VALVRGFLIISPADERSFHAQEGQTIRQSRQDRHRLGQPAPPVGTAGVLPSGRSLVRPPRPRTRVRGLAADVAARSRDRLARPRRQCRHLHHSPGNTHRAPRRSWLRTTSDHSWRSGTGAGTLRSFGSRHVHEVTNRGVEPAVSLHVYPPALVEMHQYEVSGDLLHVANSQMVGVNW
jgi:cysteine dioxygenase type I